jgi:hypothetical protein
MSVTGEVIRSENSKGNVQRLKLDTISEGIYFLKVYDTENSVFVKKIVVKR